MSITAASGFTTTGISAGIKPAGQLDLALVVGAPGTVGTAVFTTNRAAAAPVTLSREHLALGPAVRAVLLNSGCANAGTGEAGMAAARASTAVVARGVECAVEDVLVCSTGGIGKPLPVARIVAGVGQAVPQLGASPGDGTLAAQAIMTTDTVPKESTVAADGFTVGGMAKGAGMVRPDMATMLVILTTDAVVEPALLRDSLGTAVDASFHALNIDGCPSTNDTVILLASGHSRTTPEPAALTTAVTAVCWDLANQLAADAEGASRVVTMKVAGAANDAEARRAGRLVTDSVLVRAAFFGGDPNWGRLLGALGATDVDFDPAAFAIAYEGITVASGGIGVTHDEVAVQQALADGDFTVTMTIGFGPGTATVITTDLTPEYVTFNAEYS